MYACVCVWFNFCTKYQDKISLDTVCAMPLQIFINYEIEIYFMFVQFLRNFLSLILYKPICNSELMIDYNKNNCNQQNEYNFVSLSLFVCEAYNICKKESVCHYF